MVDRVSGTRLTLAELVATNAELTVAQIDLASYPGLFRRFDVRSVPTMILLVAGDPVEGFVDRTGYPDLERTTIVATASQRTPDRQTVRRSVCNSLQLLL